MTARRSRRRSGGFLAILTACVGCSGILPTSHVATSSHWAGFAESKASFDSVEPASTSVDQLRELGFDPLSTPNLRLLNHLDLISIFLPNPSITIADIDPAVRECLGDADLCRGYSLDLKVIDRERFGNVFLDMFGFRRYTRETGWAFEAILVLHGPFVVHKQWSGQPIVDRIEERVTPLGPLQEIDLGSTIRGLVD